MGADLLTPFWEEFDSRRVVARVERATRPRHRASEIPRARQPGQKQGPRCPARGAPLPFPPDSGNYPSQSRVGPPLSYPCG